jgi:hypothetical protein
MNEDMLHEAGIEVACYGLCGSDECFAIVYWEIMWRYSP